MYNSINYIEICCKYNHVDLQLFTGTLSDRMARRIFTYRNRKYTLLYSADVNLFYIFNKDNTCIAIITPSLFEFYPSRAPEIGFELVWGLLAKLNIYPVKCF